MKIIEEDYQKKKRETWIGLLRGPAPITQSTKVKHQPATKLIKNEFTEEIEKKLILEGEMKNEDR